MGAISEILGINLMGLGWIYLFKKLNILVSTSKQSKKYDHLVVGQMDNTETLVPDHL